MGGQSSAVSRPGTESEMMYEEPEDDAQTKFYKQHMVKSQPPSMASRPSARVIDSYAAEVTTKSFKQLQRARMSKREKEEDIRQHVQTSGIYSVLMSVVCGTFFLLIIYQMLQNRAHDAELRRIKQLNEKKS